MGAVQDLAHNHIIPYWVAKLARIIEGIGSCVKLFTFMLSEST